MDSRVTHAFLLFASLVLAAGGLVLSGCPSEPTAADPASPQTPGDEYFVFVDAVSGNDGAAGTKSEPVDDISEGIALAETGGKDVCVAEGTYEVNASLDTHIVMVEGVSLYGGYRNSGGTWTRNISSYTTTITDLSTSLATDNRAIACESGTVTTDTIIDGFTVNGGGGDASSAIKINGCSATVSNNTLNGGSGATWSHAVRVDSSPAAQIIHNSLNGGSGGNSVGIITSGSDTYIAYNSISGGNGASASNGIYVGADGHPEIEHNTIDAGTSTRALAILLASNTYASIAANKLTASGGDFRYGIWESVTSSVPVAVIGNVFSSTLLDGPEDCCLYADANGGGGITDIAALNALDENGYNLDGTVYGNTYLTE